MCGLGIHSDEQQVLQQQRQHRTPAPYAEGLLKHDAHHFQEVVHPLLVSCHDAHVGGGTIASLRAHHAAAQWFQAADLHHLTICQLKRNSSCSENC